MKSTVFKYIDGSRQDPIILIPGWATDYRIFKLRDGSHNENRPYLIPIQFSPFDFEKRLLEKLRETGIAKISLFGHSLGGFVAQEFALKHPDLVDELILVSIRKRYKAEELEEAKRCLKRNKKAYLYKFYRQAFSDNDKMRSFRERLLKSYLEELSLDFLLETLDYLANSELKSHLLKDIKRIKLIHGEKDRIAPIEEALDIKKSLPQAIFVVIKNAGHFPFF